MKIDLERLDEKYHTISKESAGKILVCVQKYSELKKKYITIDTYFICQNQLSSIHKFNLYHNNNYRKGFHFQGYFRTIESVYEFMSTHKQKHFQYHKQDFAKLCVR